MDSLHPDIVAQLLTLAQLGVIAAVVGWLAERLLNTGVSTRGLPLLAGLFGIYLSSHISFLDIARGPTLAGQAVLPAFVGAFVVCSFLKLASLGLAGPRW